MLVKKMSKKLTEKAEEALNIIDGIGSKQTLYCLN